MEPKTIDRDKPVLAQPLRRVLELNELEEGDLVLVVGNFVPQTELEAKFWYSAVTTVESSRMESGVHFAGPIWVVRLKDHGCVYPDVTNPREPANGVFDAQGDWIVQLYLLLSATEILGTRLLSVR